MKISEAQLKHSVAEYLEYGRNLGKWMSLRLNAGDYIETRGTTRRRVRGCPKGTSDFLVIKDGKAIFIELKSEKGRQSEDQLDFQQLVYYHKATYHVIRSLEELQEIVG